MIKRFVIDDHILEDTEEDKFYQSRDQAYVHIANVLYTELKEINRRLSILLDYEDWLIKKWNEGSKNDLPSKWSRWLSYSKYR